jgi:hypothetical protein
MDMLIGVFCDFAGPKWQNSEHKEKQKEVHKEMRR